MGNNPTAKRKQLKAPREYLNGKKHKLPELREIELPTRDYQPSKAEREEEYDMPKAKIGTLRRAFFRPFSVRKPR